MVAQIENPTDPGGGGGGGGGATPVDPGGDGGGGTPAPTPAPKRPKAIAPLIPNGPKATAPLIPPTRPKATAPLIPKGPGRPPGSGRVPAPGPGTTPPLPKSTPTPTPDPGSPILPPAVPQAAPTRTDTFVPLVNTPLPVIYGATRVGGLVFYDRVQTNGTRIVGYAVCWGEVNSISNVLIDGKTLVALGVASHIYTGTAGQGVDSYGAAAEPTLWTSGFPDVAYVVAVFPAPAPEQPLPNVRNFLCDVQGLKVYDPRTDATLTTQYYRDNPALEIADFLCSSKYGAGFAKTTVDYAGSVTTAANDCDAIIDGVSTKRFTAGIKLLDQKTAPDTINYMRSHAALNYAFNAGLHQIWMDKNAGASGLALTDTGSGANIVSAGPLVIAGAKQVPSRVRVNFVNAAANYKDDTTWSDDAGIAGGTVELIERTYDLGQITYDQAARLALQYRKRGMMDKSAAIRTLCDGGEQVLPGCVIAVTSAELNWSSQSCAVTDWQSTGDPRAPWVGRVELQDPAIYDDTKLTAAAYAPPAAPSPYDPPPNVTGVTQSAGYSLALGPATIYWSAPANYPFVASYRVYDYRSATRILFATIPAYAIPSSVVSLNIDPICTRSNPYNNWPGGGTWAINTVVTVVSTAGAESTGVNTTNAGFAAATGAPIGPYVNQTENSLTLTNGLNSNIATMSGPGLMTITGPLAAFSVGGFNQPAGGGFVRLYNPTSYAMTIVNEDALSTAANRIKTLTGADRTLNGPCEIVLDYNTTDNRWVLAAGNDGAGSIAGVSSVVGYSGAVTLANLVTGGVAPLNSPTFTGVPVAPTAAGGTNTTQVATTAFVHADAVALQATTPGTQQTGHSNLSGTIIAGAFSGPLTGNVTGNVTGSAGTVTSIASHASTELSDTANIARLNAANSFSLINPLTTSAESWIGPSSTAGIYFKGGNVGIGTTNPQAALHVNGQVIFTDATATMKYGVGRWDYGVLSVTGLFANNGYSNAAIGLGFDSAGTPVPAVTIRQSGNVGIGTTAPGAKLAINGGLHVGGDSDPGNDNLLVDGSLGVGGTASYNSDVQGAAANVTGRIWANSIAYAATALIECGNGTSSSRYAYVNTFAAETVAKSWGAGMYGTLNWRVQDITRSVSALEIDSATGIVTVGTQYATTVWAGNGTSSALIGVGGIRLTSAVGTLLSSDHLISFDGSTNLVTFQKASGVGNWEFDGGTVRVGTVALNNLAVTATSIDSLNNGVAATLSLNPSGGSVTAPTAAITTNTTQVATTAFVQTADHVNGVKERGRTALIGEWVTPTFAAGDFTGSAAMTWTVIAGNVTTHEYMPVGKTITVAFAIELTTIGGVPNGTMLQMAIPGGYTAAHATRAACTYIDNGAAEVTNWCDVIAGGTVIRCWRVGRANWSLSTNLTSVYGLISFEIQ